MDPLFKIDLVFEACHAGNGYRAGSVCGPEKLGPLKLIQLIQFQAAGLGAFGPNLGALHYVSSASSGHGGGYIYIYIQTIKIHKKTYQQIQKNISATVPGACGGNEVEC